MAALYRGFVGLGFAPSDFWALTPRHYALLAHEAGRRQSEERVTSAWLSAMLARQERLPALETLLPRPPRSREEAAAEMQAAMAVYREVAATRGLIRSWDEWQH
ncbi:phage tail assembly chaperone [Falsigemmobacter faecalis]|uniref:Phage tail assembly chaperone n=1 Tax=Falsigemmobacter faecalis TaxID=2488730 RepID=A0A3P3DCU9_9RHOB|nr:phage tail assembly chaperone [Falsigemmobacter faecalis]RRH71262.1 phage tail assembly chaperone [Falsigemmobacter faecalis]